MDQQILEFKTCIVGDTDVGKTSISLRFIHGEAPTSVNPTIGASFLQKQITVDGKELVLQLWDTAGQERFRSMAPMYYRNARAAVLVFDQSNPASFSKIAQWKSDIRVHAGEDVVMAIVGNKSDKPTNFDMDIARNYAREEGIPIFQTSAYTGHGIDEMFYDLAQRALDVLKKQVSASRGGHPAKIKLEDSPTTTICDEGIQGGGCC
mmetsp:Transcript_28818/g.37867  ORF Transcript_28818/g.37867 Transcript_28818/m.37867 type:complete len:207 (-) Transcript_28818:274-894(-)|eukprot:CAMPEP_0117747116 /NCGR_PEP_ID=MMETSP0947-20121206/8323_1 /TAXON_ID=44440 /ORGANISM="Chattonella subsalsa, Strain CCMP2191" /LENGTH=206 /DNA_ID=CAMNT_0005564515 /DNA_START=165 /DNA_END=785 /DNA_ORIENTATION=-